MMLADRLFFTAMIIIPVLITVSAGYALRYEKLNTIPVAVVDEDQSSSSVLLADRLKGREGITLFIVGGEEAEKMLENNEVEQVFVIRQGFGESLKRGESDGLIEMHSSPSSYSAGFTREVVAGEAIRLVMNSMAANDVTSKYDELGIEMEAASGRGGGICRRLLGAGTADDHRLAGNLKGPVLNPWTGFRCRRRPRLPQA